MNSNKDMKYGFYCPNTNTFFKISTLQHYEQLLKTVNPAQTQIFCQTEKESFQTSKRQIDWQKFYVD